MTTANYYVLPAALVRNQELIEKRSRVATKQPKFIRPNAQAEPEMRLWKICAEAASPRFSGFERIALLALGTSAVFAFACCAFEWSHLFNSGALDQVVRALLTR
jgi:hypothetical protein